MIDANEPLDAWLKFDEDSDEEAAYEANTYYVGGEDPYCVEYCHTAVGQVDYAWFRTYNAAAQWLEDAGFIDFTS